MVKFVLLFVQPNVGQEVSWDKTSQRDSWCSMYVWIS